MFTEKHPVVQPFILLVVIIMYNYLNYAVCVKSKWINGKINIYATHFHTYDKFQNIFRIYSFIHFKITKNSRLLV